MSKNKRIWAWVAGTAGIILSLLLILILLLPFLIDQKIIRERIMAELSRRLKGQVETQRLSLSFLPHPHATMHQAEIIIPGIARIKASSITTYPSLLNLLKGRFPINTIEADVPVILLEIAKGKRLEEARTLDIGQVQDEIRSSLDLMAKTMPGLTARMNQGEIHLFVETEPAIHFRNIAGEIHFPPNLFLVNLSGSSNMGELIAIEGLIDPEDLRIQGHLRMTGFHLQRAAETFTLPLPRELKDSILTLDLTFESRDPEVLQVTIHQFNINREPDEGLFPLPLNTQGHLILAKTHVIMSGIEGSIGQSSFSHLNGRIDWEENLVLQIDSLLAGLMLHEMYPWLLSYESVKKRLKNLTALEGVLLIHELSLNGPLREPRRWIFRGEGKVEELRVESSYIPPHLLAKGGGFIADSNQVGLPSPLITHGQLIIEETHGIISGAEGSLGNSSFSHLNCRIDWTEILTLQIDQVVAELMLHELYPWLLSYESVKKRLKNLTTLEGVLLIDELSLNGPLREPRSWIFRGEGKVEELRVESSFVPALVSTDGGRIIADRDKVAITDWKINFMDADIVASGSIENYLKRPLKVDMEFDGDLGLQAVRWTADRLNVPAVLRMDRARQIENVSLIWDEGKETNVSGKLFLEDSTEIVLDLITRKEFWSIRQAHIVDEDSDFTFGFELQDKDLDFFFKGNLNLATLDRILEIDHYLEGRIKGDFQARILLDQPKQSTAEGNIEINRFSYLKYPVHVERAIVRAIGNRVEIESSRFLWSGEKRGTLTGNIEFSDEYFQVDMDIETDGLAWEDLQELRPVPANGEETSFDFPIIGVIRVKPDYFRYGRFIWKPAHAQILFHEEKKTEIRINNISLCGIETPGNINLDPQGVHVDFNVVAGEQPLRETLECLWERGDLMVGNFYLVGKINSMRNGENLIESLRGKVEFASENGRIFRFGLLARIFAVINITEILRGKTPDLIQEGLAFDNLIAEVSIEGRSLILEELILVGPSMNLFCIGNLNLQENTVDLTVTVAPFRTIDAIIDRIPFIGDILGGTLISFPVRVTGKMDDPFVNPISPRAVGDRMIGIMERTMTYPFRLIQPLFPDEGEEISK
jgi:hypothetical protein